MLHEHARNVCMCLHVSISPRFFVQQLDRRTCTHELSSQSGPTHCSCPLTMSGEEDQHSSSLAGSDASDTEPYSPPPPAIFCTSSFFSKKRQRPFSAFNDKGGQEQQRRPSAPSDGSDRQSKKPKQMPSLQSPQSSTPSRRSSLRTLSPNPSFSDNENVPSPQEDLFNPQPVNDKDVSCTDPEVKSALKEITSILNTVVNLLLQKTRKCLFLLLLG